MLVCIITATVFSLGKVCQPGAARTVGLVTGAVLTVSGASMIFLQYRSFFPF